jgi:uncharacterized membrane protein HdeD (DUF308 family)
MKRITPGILYFIAGIMSIITAIMYLINNKTSFGVCYICIAVTFITIGLRIRSNNK